MHDLAEYERFTARLTANLAELAGARGLLLLGSSAAAERRDRWSDHDFFAILENGFDGTRRTALDWLPDPDRVVSVAREGEIGFTVVYEDAHVLEFAVATLDELRTAGVDRFRIEFGDDAVHRFAADAQARAPSAATEIDASNEVKLAYIKLLIGFGRACRGERITAGLFVRSWALGHVLRATRARIPSNDVGLTDPFDPARRLETDHPEIARTLDHLLEQPVELAASELAQVLRDLLEPGWTEFPASLADLVQAVIHQTLQSREA